MQLFIYLPLGSSFIKTLIMKTLFTILGVAVIAALMSFNEPLKSSSGAPAGHTGSPGDGANCTACHGGMAQNIDGVFSSNIPPSGYVPGDSYTITVTTSGTGRKGFQVSPQDANGNLLGTLTAGTNNKLVGNNKYVTHSSGITGQTAEWSFNWTAPASGLDQVVFYGAFVISQPVVRLSTYTVSEDLSIGIGEILSQGFQILPNYENNSLKLSYRLDESTNVAMNLYDLSGRLVAGHVLGLQAAGVNSHQLQYEAKAQKSILIAVLQLGNKTFTRKILF
jgi:hypothetical protein